MDAMEGETWKECSSAGVGACTAAGDGKLGLLAVLQTDLVMDQLMKYFSFEDMKVLRSVSKDACEAVRKSKAFLERARIKVNGHAITSGVLRESRCSWKNISFDLYSIPDGALDLILLQSRLPEMLESARALTLYNSKAGVGGEHVGRILKQLKNLRELEMYVADIFQKNRPDLLAFAEFQQILRNLDFLKIQYSKTSNEIEMKEVSPLHENFLQLSQFPVKLKRFVFSVWLSPSGTEEAKDDLFSSILKTLDASKETLEDVELKLDFCKTKGMESIRFPNLKRLTVQVAGLNLKAFNAFLENQPPLEALDILIFGIFTGTLFVDLNGTNLRKLRISNQAFYATSEPVDWTFLGTLSKLEEFVFQGPDRTHPLCKQYNLRQECVHEITGCLPQTVKKLSITGFRHFWSFDRDRPLDDCIGQHFRRFKDLTDLNLLGCRNAIDDNALQSLIKKCPGLRKLAFSHCKNVTDSGISGTTHQTDLAISELKGLVALAIWFCPNVTSDCLSEVVRFKHLQRFEYVQANEMENPFLFHILWFNPCLEEVVMNVKINGRMELEQKQSFDELRDMAKIFRPRVKLRIPECERRGWGC